MQLIEYCPVCLDRHQKQENEIRASVEPQFLDIVLTALPKLKKATILKETKLKDKILVQYGPCKHSILTDIIETKTTASTDLTSLTKGYTAYHYQAEGVTFGEQTDYNMLCADEMGLGKTVQALLLLRKWLKAKRGKCLIIVPSSTLYQWVNQFGEWCSQDGLALQPIISSKNPILPIFDCYIVSMDLLPDIIDKIKPLGIKLVIADEVQSFKNPGSARSKTLVKLIQTCNIKHKIFLSGTPIKNRLGEYFTVLNLLAPAYFPSWRQFVIRWLEAETTKSGAVIYRRLRKYAIDDFRILTSRWIIRRETKEVQADLPPIRFNYQEIEITDPNLKHAYNAAVDSFSDWFNDSKTKKDSISLLGWLAKIRHETEFAKCPQVAELAKEFLDSTEESNVKLAIGIHHRDVRDNLHYSLEPYGCVKLSGENSALEKQTIKQQFQKPETRVLVINELSGGVGMDGLQVCNNVFIVALQWSPVDEEQFIKRFNRDRSNLVAEGVMTLEQAQLPTYVTVIMAHNTVDTFFYVQCETKKQILKEAYGNWDIATDTDSLMDLASQVIGSRL